MSLDTCRNAAIPTGPDSNIDSFQLSLLGLGVVTNRLILDTLSDQPTSHGTLAVHNALQACERVARLILALTQRDCDLFWIPCTRL